MQTHLALSCKSLLPILGMGHVRVNIDKHGGGRPLHKASRFLTKQPGGVSHLEVSARNNNASVERECFGSRHRINLRCAHAPTWCWCMQWCGPCPCFAMALHHAGWTGANAAVRFCSLLSNLRELTLDNVNVSLPALQPVATRLRELDIYGSCLKGSADGFLTGMDRPDLTVPHPHSYGKCHFDSSACASSAGGTRHHRVLAPRRFW